MVGKRSAEGKGLGHIGIRVYPDGRRFLPELHALIQRAKRSIDGLDVDVEPGLDDAKIRAVKEQLRRLDGHVSVDPRLDEPSWRKVKEQVRSLGESFKMKPTLNKAALARVREALDQDALVSVKPKLSQVKWADVKRKFRDMDTSVLVAPKLDDKRTALFRDTIRRVAKHSEATVPLLPKVDKGAWARARAVLDKHRDAKVKLQPHLVHVHEYKKKLHRLTKKRKVTIDADLDRGMARLKLAWLTRPRITKIYARLDNASYLGVNKALARLSGLRLGKQWARNVYDFFKDIDKHLPTIGLMSTAVAGLSAVLTHAVAATATFGAGLARLGSLSLLAPGFFGSAALGVTTFVLAMKDAGKYVGDLKPRFSALRKTLSSGFWAGASEPVREMVNELLPELDKRLKSTSKLMGENFGAFTRQLSKSLSPAVLDDLFDSLDKSLGRLRPGMEALAGAFSSLGVQGSRFLPRFNEWLSITLKRFERWLKLSEQNGQFNKWIESGIESLKETGTLLRHTGGFFKELNKAASSAGSDGLATAARGMERLRKATADPAMQYRLMVFFKDGRIAADNMYKSVGALLSSLGRIAPTLGESMVHSAAAFSTVFRSLGRAIENSHFRKGLVALFAGFEAGVAGLEDSARSVAMILGGFGRTIGAVARSVAPTLIELGNAFAPVVDAIADLAERSVPTLRAVGGAVTSTFGVMLQVVPPVADALGTLIEMVGQLPGPLLAGGAAFILFKQGLQRVDMWSNKAALSMVAFARESATAVRNQTVIAGGMSRISVATGVVAAGARKAGLALKAAFLSNPIGIAIAGLTTLVGAFAASQAQAKADADELAATLDKQTGAITKNTRAIVAKQLRESGALSVAKQYGVAVSDMVSDVLGEAEAHERVTKALAEYNKAQGKTQTHMIQGQEVTTATVDANDVYARSVNNVKNSLADEITKAKEFAEATKSGTQSLIANSRAVEENRRIQEARTNAFVQSINASFQMSDAQKAVTEAVKNGSRAVVDSNGNLDVYAEKSRKVMYGLTRLSETSRDYMSALDKQGTSQAELSKRWEETKQAFRTTAEQAGYTGKALDDLANRLGMVGSYKSINIPIGADIRAGKKNVAELVELAKKQTGTVKVDASTAPAYKKLLEAVGRIDDSTGIVTIDGDKEQAVLEALSAVATINEKTGVVTIDGNSAEGREALEAFRRTIRKRTNVQIGADTDYAWSAIERLRAGIRRTINMQIGTGRVSFAQANGAVVDYYAHGGIRDRNHVAQIAPAGAWRVWAEPETGGEAYIPLAEHKRQRSMEILSHVAHRFGAKLLPNNNGNVYQPNNNALFPKIVRLIVGEQEFNAYVDTRADARVLEGMRI